LHHSTLGVSVIKKKQKKKKNMHLILDVLVKAQVVREVGLPVSLLFSIDLQPRVE